MCDGRAARDEEATVGFRLRKSITLVPGVRMTFSKTGIGYSVGVKGYRVTKRADGRTQRTASLPGTGVSYVSTRGSATRGSAMKAPSKRAAPRRSPLPAPPAPGTAKPGLFAPRAEKDLYRAVQTRDAAAMERITQSQPQLALAAATISGVLKLSAADRPRAKTLLAWVFATGKDPAVDPFIMKYVSFRFRLEIVVGAIADLGLDRASVGLALAELHQTDGELAEAIDVVEQLEPTTFAALSLAELYVQAARYDDIVELTSGIVNHDDATALLCVFRGVALREKELLDAAREAFAEALASRKRAPVIRHRALLERARTYEAEGKRALARKDLERILAEDSHYEGLAEELQALGE
jgi:tetratricopeptide (TPR) repeat protein